MTVFAIKLSVTSEVVLRSAVALYWTDEKERTVTDGTPGVRSNSGRAESRPVIELPDSAAIARFCEANHIARLSLFGSALAGPLRSESDVDLLVEFLPAHIPGLFRIAAMERELSAMFRRRADLRTAADLSRHFRDGVVRGALELYDARG